MQAAVQNGIEIEITVRQRSGGRPVGKAGHAFVIAEGEAAGASERKRIAEEVQSRADEFLKSRLVAPR